MAKVSVTINSRKYQIACDDGQEAHLTRLGAYVDKRVSQLVAAVGQVGDSRLLVMASLLVADELSDTYSELDVLRDSDAGGTAPMEDDKTLNERIKNLALRIEDIAKDLEQS